MPNEFGARAPGKYHERRACGAGRVGEAYLGGMAQRSKHHRAALALFAAASMHVGLVALWQGSGEQKPAATSPDLVGLASVELVAASYAPELSSDAPPALRGAADQLAASPDLALRDRADAPGRELGRASPGRSGQDSFVPRRDSDARSKSLWNTAAAAQMRHTGDLPTGEHSPESLERSEAPAFSADPRRRQQARAGAEKASAGLNDSRGQGGAPGEEGDEWFAMDPRFDVAPRATHKEVSGALRTSSEAPRSERGEASAESRLRGPAQESLHAPARASRQSASPFDLGAPSAGSGTALGANGRRGKSTARHQEDGTAAQAGRGKGESLASTQATRSTPYFYAMYRRIDKALRFPKKLALGLEQGELVLAFELDGAGQVHSLGVQKGSGFPAFDREALRAFRAAAPFGAVPKSLLQGRKRLRVIAPYFFRNPLIR